MAQRKTTFTQKQFQEWEQEIIASVQQKEWTPPDTTAADIQARIDWMFKQPAEALVFLFPHAFDCPLTPRHKDMAKTAMTQKRETRVDECHREFGKSTLKERVFILRFLKGWTKFYVRQCLTKDLATISLISIQSEIEHNPILRHYFGDLKVHGHWSKDQFVLNYKGNRAMFMAAGKGQSLRGLRYGNWRITDLDLDDLDDDQSVENEATLNKQEKALRRGSLNATRRDGEFRFIWMTGTPIGEDNLLRRVSKIKSFKVYRWPTEDENGNVLWPERYTFEMLREWEAEIGTLAYRQECLLIPTKEGHLIKPEQIRFARTPRLDTFDACVLFIDLSYVKSGDYKAGVLLWLRLRNDQPHYHGTKVFCRKCDEDEWLQWCDELYRYYAKRNYTPPGYYDGAVTQELYHEPLIREYEKRVGRRIPLRADKTKHPNKLIHGQRILSDLQRGNITFCQSLENTPDMNAAIDQLLTFGNGSNKHDDFPDALASAHLHLEPYNIARAGEATEPELELREELSW